MRRQNRHRPHPCPLICYNRVVDDKYKSVRGVITKGDQILLMHRKMDGEEYWAFPGGKAEEGEAPEQTLKREVWEECSLHVTQIGQMYTYPHPKDIKACFFECGVGDGEPKLDHSGTEKITDTDWYNPEWISISDAKKLEKLYPEPMTIKVRELGVLKT